VKPTNRPGPGVLAALLIVFLCPASALHAGVYEGSVIDARTRRPIAGAIVTLANTTVQTRRDGSFRIEGEGASVGVRAHGYSRHDGVVPPSPADRIEVRLWHLSPRAVYLSLSAMGNPELREAVARLPGATRVNSLVLDVKDDMGDLALPTPGDGVARGPDRSREFKNLLDRFRREKLYTIARIAVFKDERLARARPELALRAEDGSVVLDNDGKAWTDPRHRAIWDYNIAFAVEAARRGFDEIQFDFVRFPSVTAAPQLSADTRRAAIRGFLAQARAALVPYNVFVAADVFGYASWDPGDNNIGQKLEDIAAEVDYVCLMLYPSSFKRGLPTARQPLNRADRIVSLSLRKAQRRTGLPAVRFRPWLQAFPDYNFDRRIFGQREIGAQVRAAERFGSGGWMLWNLHSLYIARDLPARIVGARQAAR